MHRNRSRLANAAYIRRTETNGGIAPTSGCEASALAHVWQAERFSWWMTRLLHSFPEDSGFDQKVQRAELEFLARSVSPSATATATLSPEDAKGHIGETATVGAPGIAPRYES